jgi:preprotein translocase SecE subunit
VARNRKRAKERRARRPQGVTAAARVNRDATPDPIEHASPDVELAEAQMALGRPENVEDSAASEAEFEREAEESIATDAAVAEESRATDAAVADQPRAATAASSEVEAPAPSAPPAHREGLVTRLIAFLQGSWRELQRVQWPDRRQVIQATGVVLGFVIVAGVFLGVADFLAGKLMNYILTGHFK